MSMTAADCIRISELDCYVAGSMADGEAAELEQHIHQCARCLARLSELLGVDCSESMGSFTTAVLSATATPQPAATHHGSWYANFPQRADALSRYKPLRISGAGGAGIVWEAWDELMKRTVAVKLLPSDRSSPSEVARFLQEANVLARLSHPNIVSVYELTYHEGRLAIVMEYISGRTLAEQIRGGPVSETEAINALCVIAGALDHAHHNGVIHRDLKPSNLLLRWREPLGDHTQVLGNAEIKVSDFGLARVMDQQGMTQTGQRLGTPTYMAPEQVAGDVAAIGVCTDIHGLGAILYELLTGRPPFTSSDPLVTMAMIRQNEPVSPRLLQPKLSREIELICLKCLAKSPGHRYESAAALLGDLQALLAGQPISARPIGPVRQSIRWAIRNKALAASAGVAVLSVAALIHQSVSFAWTQKRMRDESVVMERSANQKAVAAEQASQTAQAYAKALRDQLRSTIAELEYVQHYLESTGALPITDAASAERRAIVMNTTLRAYENYLQFVGVDKSLQTEDLPIATRHVQLAKSLNPDRDLQPQLARIADCIRRLTDSDHNDPTIRDAEILYNFTAARDHWDRGRSLESAECFVQAAKLTSSATDSYTPGDSRHIIMLRNESMFLEGASAMYSTQELHQKAIDAALNVCRIREHIISLGSANDEDTLQLIHSRLLLARQYRRISDIRLADLAVKSALTAAQELRDQKPARAAEIDTLLEKHRDVLDSNPNATSL